MKQNNTIIVLVVSLTVLMLGLYKIYHTPESELLSNCYSNLFLENSRIRTANLLVDINKMSSTTEPAPNSPTEYSLRVNYFDSNKNKKLVIDKYFAEHGNVIYFVYLEDGKPFFVNSTLEENKIVNGEVVSSSTDKIEYLLKNGQVCRELVNGVDMNKDSDIFNKRKVFVDKLISEYR